MAKMFPVEDLLEILKTLEKLHLFLFILLPTPIIEPVTTYSFKNI